jgi:hypothetical protein
MDDFIGRLVANTGVDRTAAEKAVGIIVRFLFKEGPTEKVRALIRVMPGADAAMLAADPGSSSPSLFGALGGQMGVGGELMAARPSMGQIQAVTRETMSFVREKAGEDAVGEIVGGIPGLG